MIMDKDEKRHIPVLINEIVEYLNPQPGQVFVDCTLGGGGHTLALAEKVGEEGSVIAIDLDSDAIKRFEKKYNKIKIKLVQGNFKDLKKIVYDNGLNKVNGILLDLGLSSFQLADPERGFSFQVLGPLRMNFNPNAQFSAEEIINSWSEAEIARIIWEYGEERFSRQIAKQIYQDRKKQRIETTEQLIETIKKAVPKGYQHQKIHFATRTFQALRIAVNDELGSLEKVLPQAIDLLEKNGRLAVISFHSLEDRIIKQYLKQESRKENSSIKLINKKVIMPTFEERKNNPRSRSAKLRVAEKIV